MRTRVARPCRLAPPSLAALVLAGLAAATTGLSAQLKTPTDWRWRTDAPSAVTEDSKLPGDTWYYVAMPPGWHVTTRPGVLLYHPDYAGRGRFTLESEIFLFPGDSPSEYGIFLGGRQLEEGAGAPGYVAFVLRRDGAAAVLRRTASGTEQITPWTPHEAIVPYKSGDSPVKNVLKVDVGTATVDFDVNGQRVLSVPREGLDVDGRIGLRFGAGLNLHVTTFDITSRLAPPRRASAKG